MRAFACPVCRSLVFFHNSVCVTCKTALGFDRPTGAILALTPTDAGLRTTGDGPARRPCANIRLAACNWLARVDGPLLCSSCLLTRTRPADADTRGLASFLRAEVAKRHLLFQLDELRLPVVGRADDPQHGLAFDLLGRSEGPVITGHDNGLITIDLAEGEDGYREALRVRLAEPYRTLLGHFRHEVGHWYWDVLISGSPLLQECRALFGDERADYAAALTLHYDSEPLPGWQQQHVSVYATAHPWEDWAETFAHYLHLRDTLQTASAFGIWVGGPDVHVHTSPKAPLSALPDDNVEDFDAIITTWLPLTLALNAVNRSMGKDDLYPFVLSPGVQDKLRFVDTVVRSAQAAASVSTGPSWEST